MPNYEHKLDPNIAVNFDHNTEKSIRFNYTVTIHTVRRSKIPKLDFNLLIGTVN